MRRRSPARPDAPAVFYELRHHAGSGAAVDGIANAAPLAEMRTGACPVPVAPSVTAADNGRSTVRRDRPERRSLLGSQATDTGKGMLFGNPTCGRFRAVLRNRSDHPRQINVSGASLLGSLVIPDRPHAEHGLSHTVSTARRRLLPRVVDPSDPTRYMVDGVSTR